MKGPPGGLYPGFKLLWPAFCIHARVFPLRIRSAADLAVSKDFKKEVSFMFHRKNSLVLAMTLLVVMGAASVASAGGSIFAGANFPTGGFGDGAKTGWTAGGYYTADLMPIVDIGGLIAYNDWSTDLSGVAENLDPFGGSINAWEFHALGQLKVAILKGFLGLGFANYKGLDDNLESSRKTDFSWQLGLSANIAVLEGRLGYHQIPVDGGSINWVKLSVGLTF